MSSLPGPTILRAIPEQGGRSCPPLQTRGPPQLYQNSIYSKG